MLLHQQNGCLKSLGKHQIFQLAFSEPKQKFIAFALHRYVLEQKRNTSLVTKQMGVVIGIEIYWKPCFLRQFQKHNAWLILI
jgi:hypothetical protein